MKRRAKRPNLCPCGRVTDKGQRARFNKCCGALHQGLLPPTPEALMRSRYTAYSLGLVSYVMATTPPDGPHWREDADAWASDLEGWCTRTAFQGLQILEAEPENADGDAFVTFHARLSQDGHDISFTERSRFRRHERRWKYIEEAP